jgi:hypothetical protein
MTDAIHDVEVSWSAIQAMTAGMRSAAAGEEWAKVMELATQRHQNLLDHFARFPIGPDNADFYRHRITEMLSSEQELQNLAIDARRQVMRAAVTTNQNHRAVGAYLSTAAR